MLRLRMSCLSKALPLLPELAIGLGVDLGFLGLAHAAGVDGLRGAPFGVNRAGLGVYGIATRSGFTEFALGKPLAYCCGKFGHV